MSKVGDDVKFAFESGPASVSLYETALAEYEDSRLCRNREIRACSRAAYLDLK